MTASRFCLLLGSILALAPLAAPPTTAPPSTATASCTGCRCRPRAGRWPAKTPDSTCRSYLGRRRHHPSSELQLALESAISVMPEASTLVATVNRQTIGRIGLGNQGAAPAAITIPPSVLRAGWNTLSLVASQRHRVDCSIDGTYELWTRIDPGHSASRSPRP